VGSRIHIPTQKRVIKPFCSFMADSNSYDSSHFSPHALLRQRPLHLSGREAAQIYCSLSGCFDNGWWCDSEAGGSQTRGWSSGYTLPRRYSTHSTGTCFQVHVPASAQVHTVTLYIRLRLFSPHRSSNSIRLHTCAGI
jgi:hypothetical protein